MEFKDPQELFEPVDESDLYKIHLDPEEYLTPSMNTINLNDEEFNPLSEDEKSTQKCNYNLEELYKRPGLIENKSIAKWKDGIVTLKPNLRMVS